MPPVNCNSPLVAVMTNPAPGVGASGSTEPPASFKFGPMARALRDEDRESMRKTASAPHSMNKLGGGSHVLSPKALNRHGGAGPIRRVSTAMAPLSMRRPSTFMWTMDVHRDFESAVQSLISKGRDLSSIDASEVLGLMKYSGAEGLTETSIERHLQKRQALQQKLSAMLPELKAVGGGDVSSPPALPRMAAARPPAEEPPAPPSVPSSSTEPDAAAAAKAAVDESMSVSSSLGEAMQRQQAMQRQMMEQQRSMQLHALEAGVATST